MCIFSKLFKKTSPPNTLNDITEGNEKATRNLPVAFVCDLYGAATDWLRGQDLNHTTFGL